MATEVQPSDLPPILLWAFPPAYFIHLLDERFFGIGTAAWATRNMGVYLTNEAWLIINIAPEFGSLLAFNYASSARPVSAVRCS